MAPAIQHAVCWPSIPSTHPKDSNQSLRLALPNFPLQSHSCELSSCWQAPPRPPSPCTLSFCPPLLQGGEGEREVENTLTLSQGLGTPDLWAQHVTPMVFWGKGATSLSDVCKQEGLHSVGLMEERVWGLVLEALKSPFPALIL